MVTRVARVWPFVLGVRVSNMLVSVRILLGFYKVFF